VARQQRLLRQVVAVPAGIGIAILAAGVVAFVLAGYHWLVLALTWAFGMLHLGFLARTRRLRRRTQLLGLPYPITRNPTYAPRSLNPRDRPLASWSRTSGSAGTLRIAVRVVW
jgi:hypothetical protein